MMHPAAGKAMPMGGPKLIQSAYIPDGLPPVNPEDASTTTISTIAIKAGDHATIVVALLKSIGYVELRIDEMHPSLLAIGGSYEETNHLLRIHEDLMQRLREKEDQVEVLLTRADNLVHEKEDPNEQIVYEAMARSLGTAWRELNKQLQLRGYMLGDTLRFYDLSSQHEKMSHYVNQALQSALSGQADLSHLVPQLTNSINEMIDITALAVDLGSQVIAQIRTLGQINDNAERPKEILEACMLIEKVMLKMAGEWERVEQVWANEKERLIAGAQKGGDFQEIEEWVSRAEKRVKAVNEYGLNLILNEANENKSRLSTFAHLDQQRAFSLNERIDLLIQAIQQKLNASQRIQQFFASAHSMSSKLDMMEQDMRNANAAMAGELAPLARQKAAVVINDGREILSSEKLTYEEQRAINTRVQELETKLQRLESIASERTSETTQRISQQVSSLYQWLTQQAEPFLSQNGDMGRNLSEAGRFVQTHKSFGTDVVNRDVTVQSTLQQSRSLNESDRRTLSEFEQRYETLKKQLEERIQLGSTFEQVHRFARDLESSFDSLGNLLDANKEFTNEKVASQMNNVFQMIQETLGQERHQGEKFITQAHSASKSDHTLNVSNAVDSVRQLLIDHERRFTNVTEKWESWQTAKTETKKFVNVIEDIQMWQEEVIEIIGLLENTHIATTKESEGLQKRVQEIKDTFEQQERKLAESERYQQDEQISRKVEQTRNQQHYIRDKITQLERKVNTVHETLIEEEIHEVIRAPEVLAPLKNAQIEEGTRFEFAARIEAEPEPAITWLKDGVDVKQNIDYHTEFVNGVATLTIEETFIEDSAVYTVRASNKGGSVESSATLKVDSRSQMDRTIEEDKPRFVKQLQNVNVTEGETALLDCVIYGKPEPEVIWYKEEETVIENERTHLSFRGDHCSLTIERTIPSDSGLYTARAKNTLGETSNFCNVKVNVRKVPPPTPPKPISRPTSRAAKPPAIQPTLTNNTYREGDQVKMQVFITGEPRPRVQWTCNEQPIITTTNVHIEEEESGWSRLIIDSVTPEHAGMYTVYAENEAGEARTGATLHVTPGQPMESTQTMQTIQEMTTVNTSSHHVPIEKEITQNGTTTVQSTNFTRVMNEGGYWTDGNFTGSPTPPPIPKHRYQVEEYSETDMSEIGFSRIATEPEFIRPFVNEYTVNEGEKLRMECLMVGSPRPKVQWFFNDRNISLSQGFVDLSNVGDTYSIIINNATLQHAGYYKMTAENCRGKTESLTVVHVRPRSMQRRREEEEYLQRELHQREMIRRTQSPQQAPSRHGERKTVTEEYAMYEVEQRRPAKHHEGSRLITPPPAKKQVIQEHHQRVENQDQYEIEQQRRAAGHPPHFTQTLVSAVAAQGEGAKFEGIVTGWPAPEIEWTKDGAVISRSTHPDISFSNIGGRVSLSFASSTLEHAGKYMCTARNASGVATSSAQLVVRPKTVAPDFIQRLISEEIVEGEQLKWTVKVTGDPMPKVTWLRDGVVIPDCEEVRIMEEDDGVNSLLILRVEMADCGQFTCLAENIAGEARSTADLVVRPPGTDPGNYFHVTKVTQEKQVKGEDHSQHLSSAFAIENPRHTPSSLI